MWRQLSGGDDLLPNDGARWKEAECLGVDQCDDVEGEGYATEAIQRSKVHIDLDRCRQMLVRRDEIERASALRRREEVEA